MPKNGGKKNKSGGVATTTAAKAPNVSSTTKVPNTMGAKVGKRFQDRGTMRPGKEAAADKLMRVAGARGKNALAEVHRELQRETLSALNQDATLDIEPGVQKAAIIYMAMGIMLAAKKRGWNSQNDPDLGFMAFGYLVDTFVSALKGAVPQISQAPRWFWELLAALAPKEKPHVTARVYYEPVIVEGGPTVSSVMTLGIDGEQYNVVWGKATGNAVNGFPTVVPTPVPYDAALGAEAFSSIWNVFPAEPNTPTELVGNLGDTAYNKRDCSVFAVNDTRLGASYFAPGGFASFLENEVHIDSPLLAKFCFRQLMDEEGAIKKRAGFTCYPSGGTACYIGPRCLEFNTLGQFRNKARAVFKQYDFWEFVETFGIFIGLVQENKAKLTETPLIVYPLTIQQFAIILRQAMIPMFGNEMAQDLRFQETGGTLPLLPFVVCDNGVSQTALTEAPLFPRYFTEVLKACARVTANVGKWQNGARTTMDWVPVLSGLKQAPINNYTYGEGAQVFIDGTTLIPPEVPVSMVDLSCSVEDPPVTKYLNLNGEEYSRLVSLHNEWMTGNQPYMTGLSKFTASKGSVLFSTVIGTKIVRELQSDALTTMFEKPPSTSSVKVKLPKTGPSAIAATRKGKKSYGHSVKGRIKQVQPSENSTWYQFLEPRAIISNMPFMRELEKYAGASIYPWFFGADARSSQASDYVQSAYGELIKINTGDYQDDNTFVDVSSYPTVYSTHVRIAELDCKNISNSGRTEIEVLLDTLEEKGQGGFLTSLSAILNAGAKMAGAAGSVLGF